MDVQIVKGLNPDRGLEWAWVAIEEVRNMGDLRTLDAKVNELLRVGTWWGVRNMEGEGLAKGLAAARIDPESGN